VAGGAAPRHSPTLRGRVTGGMVVLRDVTERQKQLRASSRARTVPRSRHGLRAGHHSVHRQRPSGIVVNRGVCGALPVPREKIIGQRLDVFLEEETISPYCRSSKRRLPVSASWWIRSSRLKESVRGTCITTSCPTSRRTGRARFWSRLVRISPIARWPKNRLTGQNRSEEANRAKVSSWQT